VFIIIVVSNVLLATGMLLLMTYLWCYFLQIYYFRSVYFLHCYYTCQNLRWSS